MVKTPQVSQQIQNIDFHIMLGLVLPDTGTSEHLFKTERPEGKAEALEAVYY